MSNMKTFALAGNPNCGKTTLFNNLTGSTAHVGNWPGVTVDKKEGTYKKLEEHVAIIDLPGIYSLSPYTPEEVISRNYILEEKPACVINIVDATNLERNLYLTTQLLEMDVPLVVALNMMDVVESHGDVIQVKDLEKKLGVPVVRISALKEDNLDELMRVAYQEALKGRQGKTLIENKEILHLINDVTIAFKGKGVVNPLFHAVKLVENDEIEAKDHPDLLPMVDEFKKSFHDEMFDDDFEALIADSRYKYISKNCAPFYKKKDPEARVLTKSDKIDRVLTNKWAGIPIFLAILFVIFHFTFSENLLFLGGLLKFDHPCFKGSMFEGLFFTEAGINSPGVILANFFTNITDWITGCVSGWLEEGSWLQGFICDGVLGGLFAVLGFLPQILFLFLFFSILEDSGYMARVAFILDRIFRKFGLSGRSFMPMIMGFGCSVPAMINTRTLADEKERTATVRVIPFFSCGAKLQILTAIAGGLVQAFGIGNADIITFAMYVIGMVTAIICVIAMRHTTMRGDVPPFIMELPAYHAPQFKSLMIHLWDKAKHFVKKAFTIILASTILIWFLSNFGWDWRPVDNMQNSILASIGQFIQPLFTPLGFGSQLNSLGWVFAVAAITGLIAKENVIATFFTLAGVIVAAATKENPIISLPPDILEEIKAVIEAGEATDDGILESLVMIKGTGITAAGCISFIAFNMLTIPCFAACATAKAELPKGKFKWTVLFWIAVSYIGAGIIYTFLSMFSSDTLAWAIPTFAGILVAAAAAILGVVYYNKKHPVKREA